MAAKSPDQAVQNGHAVSSYDVGMCQRFVRDQCWRVPSLYGSAIEAWNGARFKHPGDRTPPPGAPCYYRGGSYGHAVLFCHKGIRSTDCTSATRVSDTDIGWPERAWGYTYLGWTEDINGVRVIYPEGEEMELDDELTNWSPDEGSTGKITVGKTLNQARGFAEDGYQRVKKVEEKVDDLAKKVQKILDAVT
jgi:hypothetical protein